MLMTWSLQRTRETMINQQKKSCEIPDILAAGDAFNRLLP